jgi:putative ABC transport system permease protein
VIAYGVRQRTHEIGIRLALGATAARVVTLVLLQAARLTALGIVLGLVGAALLSRLIATMLFEARASDPWTIASVGLVLSAVVLLATLGAALHATRIEAAVALRHN